MKKLFMVLPLVLLICFTFSCQQQAEEVAEEPVVDVEAERAKIVKLLKENVEAEKNKDMEGSMRFYNKEAYTLAPGMKLMKGLRDLEGLYETIMESLVDMENDVIDIQFSEKGDMAYMIASYHMVMKGENETRDEIGKFLSVLTKKTGEWKIVAICYNADPHE
jgi:ketosteroid isomerase-like protein